MRVLFWLETFWPTIGGIEVLATKLLSALRERGCESIVVTPLHDSSRPMQDHYQGIPVYRFPFALAHNNLSRLLTLRQQVADLKRAFRPDVIHINALGLSGFFHLTTAQVYSAPLLVTLHDDRLRDDQLDLPVDNDVLAGRILRSADWISCVSTAVRTEVCRVLPEIAARSSTVHNGLDLPALLPIPLPIRAPRLLCLGRLVFRKGFDVALSAFSLVTHRFPDARLLIAGDGAARSALEHQAAELGLAEVVDFIGWVAPEQVPALINTTTVVVMPSRREPFGLVALEAAQMARPIVATRVGGLPEVVEHEQTGLLVENENVHQLAESIARLLEHPETAVRLGQTARRRAIERFSWDHCVGAYEALYRQLLTDS